MDHFCQIALEPNDIDFIVSYAREAIVAVQTRQCTVDATTRRIRIEGASSASSIDLTPLEFQSTIVSFEDEVAAWKKKCHEQGIELWKARDKAKVLANQLSAKTQECTALAQQLRFRRGFNAHVNTIGGYNLALACSRGYAGAQTTVAMMAGEQCRGAVTDRKTVTIFEHKAAIALRLRSSILLG